MRKKKIRTPYSKIETNNKKYPNMKKNIIVIICMVLSINVFAQEAKDKHLAKLPAVEIQDLNGNPFNTQDIQNDGKPVIISLWATWCKPCIAELLAIADEYEDWVEETGVKLYAVSIDDAKTSARVAPFVKGKNWEYTVLLDVNSDFKRAMNVNDVPFMCILNGDGEIVWQHTSYAPGSEEEVYEVIKSLVKK